MIAIVYKRLIQLGKVTGAIAFLFGVPYALYEYLDNQQTRRVEQTLNFFKQYNGPPYTTYREQIAVALGKRKTEVAAAVSSEKELAVFINKMVDEEKIEKDLLYRVPEGVTRAGIHESAFL